MMMMMRCKTNDQFDKFLDALDNTGQQHVRNRITGRQGLFTNRCLSEIKQLMRCSVFLLFLVKSTLI